MNRINPIYILAFLLVVFLILIYKLDNAKNNLEETQASFKSTENLAIKLSSLKNTYANKQNIKKSLQKILKHSSLKSANIVTKFRSTSLLITAKNIDKNSLNQLISKLINKSFIINKLKIRKINSSSAELSMEIKW